MALVALHGKAAFERAYGFAVNEWSVANTLDTKFELASLTKQFTGAAILLLAASGKLRLNDPISNYYSAAPNAWRDITINELVTHTSGLPANEIPDFPKGIATPYTMDELIRTFRDRPLVATPGTKWRYTNTEYYLLADVIEKVSGESYERFLDRRIFAPLGMRHSGFASTLAAIPRMAQGYTRDSAGLRHRDYFDRSLEVGAGGVYSTVGDLLRWSDALSSNALLGERWRRTMFSPDSLGDYGYGVFIDTKKGIAYHEGSDPGFATYEIRALDNDYFIVVLANLDSAPVREIANKLRAAITAAGIR